MWEELPAELLVHRHTHVTAIQPLVSKTTCCITKEQEEPEVTLLFQTYPELRQRDGMHPTTTRLKQQIQRRSKHGEQASIILQDGKPIQEQMQTVLPTTTQVLLRQ